MTKVEAFYLLPIWIGLAFARPVFEYLTLKSVSLEVVNNADANGESMMLFNMIQANHKRVQSTNEERDEAKFQKKQQQDNKMHELLVRKLTKQNGHLEKHDHHLEKHGSCLVHLQSPHHAQMKSTLKARKEKKKCNIGQRML